eukprot:gene20814-24947_t
MEAYTAEQISASCLEKYGADPFATEQIATAVSSDAITIGMTSDTGAEASNSPASDRKQLLTAFYQQRDLTAQAEQ